MRHDFRKITNPVILTLVIGIGMPVSWENAAQNTAVGPTDDQNGQHRPTKISTTKNKRENVNFDYSHLLSIFCKVKQINCGIKYFSVFSPPSFFLSLKLRVLRDRKSEMADQGQWAHIRSIQVDWLRLMKEPRGSSKNS